MKALKVEFGKEHLELILDGATIINIEKALGKSLFGIMMTGNGGMKMPRLGEMLTILHEANIKHGIKKADMPKLYDEYINNGGSQMKLFTDIIQQLMEKAGFFDTEETSKSEATDGEMNESLI